MLSDYAILKPHRSLHNSYQSKLKLLQTNVLGTDALSIPPAHLYLLSLKQMCLNDILFPLKFWRQKHFKKQCCLLVLLSYSRLPWKAIWLAWAEKTHGTSSCKLWELCAVFQVTHPFPVTKTDSRCQDGASISLGHQMTTASHLLLQKRHMSKKQTAVWLDPEILRLQAPAAQPGQACTRKMVVCFLRVTVQELFTLSLVNSTGEVMLQKILCFPRKTIPRKKKWNVSPKLP